MWVGRPYAQHGKTGKTVGRRTVAPKYRTALRLNTPARLGPVRCWPGSSEWQARQARNACAPRSGSPAADARSGPDSSGLIKASTIDPRRSKPRDSSLLVMWISQVGQTRRSRPASVPVRRGKLYAAAAPICRREASALVDQAACVEHPQLAHHPGTFRSTRAGNAVPSPRGSCGPRARCWALGKPMPLARP